MREELKKLIDADYSYTENDFDHTFRIAKNIDAEKFELLKIRQQKISEEYPNEEDFWTVIDDMNWYTYLESFYIWHFCLWRLQAILEGILITEFLDLSFKTGGLKYKLDSLSKFGFNLDPADYNQLLDWGQIRNALSHFPPQGYKEGLLSEEDVKEYLALCKSVVKKLITQKKLSSST
jgi:hypothetical protein